MKYGLTEKELKLIKDVLASNSKVEKALLFGSRAMGTYSYNSDIDILLVGKELTLRDESQLMSQMEALNISYSVDLIRKHTVTSEAVKNHVREFGVVIYEREGAGRGGNVEEGRSE
ncbi:nucleotidyltransferase domain-containing protein [Chitinispirillales bacterium ANBcel5]|uniref:nucleotidyltransferase domain-containing protein n=1 Tax=Cellulosispirillum alkaliphilum TaxID=3039283 RepID=UPI002A55C450|nr:nucleotidyltransferase domain-containing protein [Chitinispirillales bacterium ANBcel5]